MTSATPVRRRVLAALAAGAAPAAIGLPAWLAHGQARADDGPGSDRPRVLRYAFPIAETSFDPAAVTDLYSRTVCSAIFEAPLEFAFLARPVQMRPCTAAAMPEVSDGHRRFVFRIRPGIVFADHPAFGGRPRELVAEDYVYSLKRHYDPRWKSGNLYLFENAGILGLSELRKRLMDGKKPFDYDAPVEGLRTLDRHTFEIRLAEPSPRFLYNFADGSVTGAMAREVVEAHGDKVGEHPVGTGPFVLAAWTRSSRIVLARNPRFRDARYDEQPAPGDAATAATARRFAGRRLPLVDRVEISVIEEPQPRWLSFLGEEQDVQELVPAEFAQLAMPNDQLAPNLARRGVTMVRYQRPAVSMSYFGMEHPVVGGHAPHKVALRRAVALAVDVEREIRVVRRGQAIPAQGIIGPECYGYDPALRSEMGTHDLARARALLDLHGYVDRNGDGWREQPDGAPLVLEYATQPDQQSRSLAELWQKNMQALGVRIVFQTAKWPENLKSSRAGKLMMWGVGWFAGQPDGDTFLGLGYGPNKGQSNHARFDLPAYNQLYERQRALPDGPERLALMRQATRMLVAHMPYKVHVHQVVGDLAHPWVRGYHRNVFVREFFKYVDVDPVAQAASRKPPA